MRYDTVLFDAGDTLFGPRRSYGAVYARVLEGLGLSRPVASYDAALRFSWEEMERLVPSGRDRYSFFPGGEREYWLRFATCALTRVAGGSLPLGFAERALDPLREAFRRPEAWRVFDDVVPTLETLRGYGARLAVVSNWDSRLPSLLDGLKLADYFDVVTFSSAEGVEKPDPAIFRRAVARLGARADATIHVGDLPAVDLSGAEAAGLKAVLIDRDERLEPRLGALRDLRDLAAVVRGD